MKVIKQTITYVNDNSEQLKRQQIWKCMRCEHLRQWGFGPSISPRAIPYLYCKCRERHTPHVFEGLRND